MGFVRRGAVVLHTGLEQCKKCWLRFWGWEWELWETVLLQAIQFIHFDKKRTESGH